LIGAGIGAAVAGPAGAVIGGLSGKTETFSHSSSSEYLDHVELKLRLLSNEVPVMKLTFGSDIDDVERIAARIATAIEHRGTDSSTPDLGAPFENFVVSAPPEFSVGWWKKTFG
jgi:hypothetical protein